MKQIPPSLMTAIGCPHVLENHEKSILLYEEKQK
jgi:hypothetical protein